MRGCVCAYLAFFALFVPFPSRFPRPIASVPPFHICSVVVSSRFGGVGFMRLRPCGRRGRGGWGRRAGAGAEAVVVMFRVVGVTEGGGGCVVGMGFGCGSRWECGSEAR